MCVCVRACEAVCGREAEVSVGEVSGRFRAGFGRFRVGFGEVSGRFRGGFQKVSGRFARRFLEGFGEKKVSFVRNLIASGYPAKPFICFR